MCCVNFIIVFVLEEQICYFNQRVFSSLSVRKIIIDRIVIIKYSNDLLHYDGKRDSIERFYIALYVY